MRIPMNQLLHGIVATESIIPAINVSSYEMICAIFRAADREHSPVIVQSAWCEIERMGISLLQYIVQEVGEMYPKVPYALHLDHGANFQECVLAMNKGFSSVMFDGSHLEYEKNCEHTAKVVEVAHTLDISVEGEIGVLGGEGTDSLTDPVQAVDFIKMTGVDALAPAVGTAHGMYTGPVTLDIPRLKRIFNDTGIPLVLHGGSGVPVKLIHQAGESGVAKMNFSTTVRKKFKNSLVSHLQEQPEDIDIISILAAPVEACTEEIQSLMQMCRSSGKADLYSKFRPKL